ncbi:drug/metabolite exporter YedA [Dokdonella soli]|uniref:Drug/metabolite exporter YedA n=1 Tax=Dokdonella soli TaxID=529810 RepID=A0ABN1ILI6_9GAMM
MNPSSRCAPLEAAAPSTPLLGPRVLVPLALVSLYFVWGSTYLAIRVGVASYPPFLMAAIRFLCAGGVLYAFLRWRGMAAPTRAQWINSALTGVMLLGFGNGLVCYAEQSVASGLAAVAVASMPLFAAVFGGLYGHWPRRMEWLGLGVGFAGVILLNLGGSMAGSPIGALALVVAAGSWAFGSVWSKRRNMPPAAMNTAAQMLTGGAVLLVFALLIGERWPVAPPLSASLAVVYLAIAGSLVGFSAYLYLLNTVRPALATSYAYVNPPVAVLVGALFGGEAVHPFDLIAMAVILGGVALIALGRERNG